MYGGRDSCLWFSGCKRWIRGQKESEPRFQICRLCPTSAFDVAEAPFNYLAAAARHLMRHDGAEPRTGRERLAKAARAPDRRQATPLGTAEAPEYDR
jgi:hypothetical protein